MFEVMWSQKFSYCQYWVIILVCPVLDVDSSPAATFPFQSSTTSSTYFNAGLHVENEAVCVDE